MHVDTFETVVDTAFFDEMSNQWREEENRYVREIDRLQDTDKSYVETEVLAPRPGLEPGTCGLTVRRSTD